jgi:hypothetical protein
MIKKVGIELAEDNEYLRARAIDKDDQLYIFEEAVATDVFKSDNEDELFLLLFLQEPVLKRTFTDYGFTSENNHAYLYHDLILGFTIDSIEEVNKQMALFQIEEHLIAEEKYMNTTVYFVDKNLRTLIEKYGQSYEVKITFITS